MMAPTDRHYETVLATIAAADADKLEKVLARAAAENPALDGDMARRLITGKFLAYALMAGEFQRVPDGDKPITYTTVVSK